MAVGDYITVGFLCGIIGLIGGGALMRCSNSPEEIYVQAEQDFNEDGISDLLLESWNGHKTPFYSYQNGDNIRYITGSEMMELQPGSIIDYDLIEKRLNED